MARLRAELARLRRRDEEPGRLRHGPRPSPGAEHSDGQSNSLSGLDADTGVTEPLNPDQRINLTIGIGDLRDAGNATIASAAQTALWAVFHRDEQGMDRIRYRDPDAPETSAADRLGLLDGLLGGMAGLGTVTIADWTDDEDLRRKVYFTASASTSADDQPPQNGALVFRRVDAAWYLDRFEVYSRALRKTAP